MRRVEFLFFQVIFHLTAAANPRYLPKTNDEDEILIPLESRYRPRNYYRDFDRQDLPVTFQPPDYDANDFWRENRRTFFEPQEKRTTFPSFYQFMSSFFGETTTPEYNRPTPPYSYENPFPFKPTDTNYIPPPKPIRASVIKLETITRSPSLYPPFYYETRSKYSPPLGNLLNHVLIENSKVHDSQDLSFHYQLNSIGRLKSSPAIPSTVLPKPVQVPPTTLRPSLEYSRFYNNRSDNVITFRQKVGFPRYNSSGHRYPNSVQDQLPNFNFADVKIPYLPETTLNTLYSTQPSPTRLHFNYNPPYRNVSAADLKNLNWVIPNPEPIPAAIPSIVRISSFDTTTLKPLPKVFKPSNKSSVEVITNLTIEGLSKTQKDNANIQNYVNFFNLRNLINYEMKKIQTTPSTTTLIHDTKLHPVNLNDEFSLDAKILKDTNWDGLTTSQPTRLAINPRDTSLIKNRTFEDEITTTERITQKTEFFDTGITTTYIPTTILEVLENTTRINFPTTIFSITTTESNEVFSTTEEPERGFEILRETTQTIPDWFEVIRETTQQPVSEDQVETTTAPTTTTTTTTTERQSSVHPKRKYHRRPKVVNFTPFPSPADVQKKPVNRNHFPKRQKPNITLAFGNKNIVKTREEVVKFSDDDVNKRKRKLGKRRHVIKRVRVVTSEKPAEVEPLF